MSLRECWTNVVKAEDYEGHMADIGQAQANAELVKEFLLEMNLQRGARVLFAGAGSGQMFDYVGGDWLNGFNLTFTDINEEFLERLAKRADAAGLQTYRAVLDDIENPRVQGRFDLCVLVLVLEHVNWRLALERLSKLPVERLVIVIQKNPEGIASAVTRPLRGSLVAASQAEEPELLIEQELVEVMSTLGYAVARTSSRNVLDEKLMLGYLFCRSQPATR